MIAVIQRYKILLAVLSIVIIAALTWFIIERINADKIPSKGVFVLGQEIL